jgi:hypothetical protein
MGKVHGSLARAGKVKSATPKVGDFSLLCAPPTWPDISLQREPSPPPTRRLDAFFLDNHED